MRWKMRDVYDNIRKRKEGKGMVMIYATAASNAEP